MFQAQNLTRLSPGRYVHHHISVEGGHGDPVSEARLGKADGKMEHNIIPFPIQKGMGIHIDHNVEVACRATVGAQVAPVEHPQPRTRSHPGRNAEGKQAGLLYPALPLAIHAGLSHNLSISRAFFTHRFSTALPPLHFCFSISLAEGALLEDAAGPCSESLAGRAKCVIWYVYFNLSTQRGNFKRN